MNLEDINLWWHDKNWEKKDFELKKFNKMPIRWIPSWLDKLSLKPFSLNFVVGLRQVGKTTGIKLLIKKLIEAGKDPLSITYINCDLISEIKELREILMKYFLNRKKNDVLILDEVTSLEYWWKIIKGFIDLGKFENSVLIVSGSSCLRLKKYVESFSGRRGHGKTIEVLPLSFKEFLKVLKIKEYGEEVKKGFEKYLELGGFPRSINKDKKFAEEFILSIDRELKKIDREPRIAKRLIKTLLKKAPSAISFFSLGKEAEINHVTTREYMEILEDLFVSKIAFWKNKEVSFRKEKKIFLRDPFIAKAYSSLFSVELRKDFLYEWVVQEHLYRKFGEIYYYRNRYEIDCIANDMKVEVKAGKPYRKYPKNVKVVDETNIAEFLLELEK